MATPGIRSLARAMLVLPAQRSTSTRSGPARRSVAPRPVAARSPGRSCAAGRRLLCASSAAEEQKAPEPLAVEDGVGKLDIRVGRVLSAEKHPEADKLYVEQVDVGEAEPRTIVSGLAGFVELEAMQERPVVVLCNLKPRNMRGIKSFGMLLCASDEAHETVEPLAPPAEAPVGERIVFQEEPTEPASGNQLQKKKIWEAVQPELSTDQDCVARFRDMPFTTSAGVVKCDTLQGGRVS